MQGSSIAAAIVAAPCIVLIPTQLTGRFAPMNATATSAIKSLLRTERAI
jgi:hypothetical protein